MSLTPAPLQAPRLFFPEQRPEVAYPIQAVQIDWERLIAKRPIVLATIDEMPLYLLKPEVLALLDAEKHATYRLILDLMWSTGARVSEVLALTRASFVDDGYGYGVVLKTLKQRPGRPSRAALQRSAKRYVPIVDPVLRDRIETYLRTKSFRAKERLFPMARQTVNRHIQALVNRVGGAPFAISAHTFRHSFAVHLSIVRRSIQTCSPWIRGISWKGWGFTETPEVIILRGSARH